MKYIIFGFWGEGGRGEVEGGRDFRNPFNIIKNEVAIYICTPN